MATVYVSLGQVGATGIHDAVDVYTSGSLRSETVTSSGTTASGALVAVKRDMAQVYCTTGVYAKAGASPTCTAATAVYCPGGIPTYIAMQEGDKIAVLDA